MGQGIEVFGEDGSFQFGDKLKGMKVRIKAVATPINIITEDTGNSFAPNFYLANHFWSSTPLSPDCIVAVRPHTKGARFYAHFHRGLYSWFNTPGGPTSATISVFVSRPCDIYVYDYPVGGGIVGLEVFDQNGDLTFSSDGIHMRLAQQMSGAVPSLGMGDIFPVPGDVTLSLPTGEYMVCPTAKPYQIYMADAYQVGAVTLYDFNEYNPWYTIGADYITQHMRIAFSHGVSSIISSDIYFDQYNVLVLHADWEANHPIAP